MKHKHILLTTALIALISGCGDKPALTPQEKFEILKKDVEQKQTAKEAYMFDSFERTKGSSAYGNIQYTLVEDLSKATGTPPDRSTGALLELEPRWDVKNHYNIPEKFGSLEWSDYQEKGQYSQEYLKTLNNVAYRLREMGFSDAVFVEKLTDYKFGVKNHNRLSMNIPQGYHPLSFSTLLTSMLLIDTLPKTGLDHYMVSLKYVRTLIGVKYEGKALTLVEGNDVNALNKDLTLVLANEFRKRDPLHSFPTKIDSDIPVTQAQIDEWNQVFIDALKEDPFFGKNPVTPSDTSGSTSALAALKGTSGVDGTQFTMNGVAGSQVDLGLPMYVQLRGSVDQGKSTTGLMGLVAYRLGNSVVGMIQSYANSGTGFNDDSRQLETSMVAAHSFGLMFVEGQFGSVSASNVNFNDWSGVRSQVRLGIDTPFGAPFVQLTHRDFEHTSDTAGYVGFEIANTEFKADTYAFSTSLLTKVGHHSLHGATGSIDWTAALTLNNGIAFNTQLTLGSALESKAAFNLSIDR